jgi:hypothetical protein
MRLTLRLDRSLKDRNPAFSEVPPGAVPYTFVQHTAGRMDFFEFYPRGAAGLGAKPKSSGQRNITFQGQWLT